MYEFYFRCSDCDHNSLLCWIEFNYEAGGIRKVRQSIPWSVEVNPRYTASVEVLEHALGLSALALHRAIFDPAAPALSPQAFSGSLCLGKAILFARAPLIFPADGPWLRTLQAGPLPAMPPTFADIPPAGQQISAGSPILTCFARAASLAECRAALQRIVADLDHWLFTL